MFFKNLFKKQDTPAAETPAKEIYVQTLQLIDAGKIAEALEQLVKSGDSDAELLQQRFDSVQALYPAGKIDIEEWDRTQARILFALFEICRVVPPLLSLTEEVKTRIRQMVDNDQVAEALELAVQSGISDARLLKARWNSVQTFHTSGTINAEGRDKIQTQILFALQELCGTKSDTFFADPEPEIPMPPVQKEPEIIAWQKPPEVSISREQAAPQIREHLRMADTETALELLGQTGDPAARRLLGQFHAAKKQLWMGLIEYSQWERISVQTNQAIMDVEWMRESDSRQNLSLELRSHIQELLDQNRVGAAAARCHVLGDRSLLLQARYHQLHHHWEKGLLETREVEMIYAQIKKEVLNLINL